MAVVGVLATRRIRAGVIGADIVVVTGILAFVTTGTRTVAKVRLVPGAYAGAVAMATCPITGSIAPAILAGGGITVLTTGVARVGAVRTACGVCAGVVAGTGTRRGTRITC